MVESIRMTDVIFIKSPKMGEIEIKTKVNYPFIYFLFEPNVVFEYRIETHKYLTILDLSDVSKWETYEINPHEDFETFQPNERQQVEGRAFFLNQEDRMKIIEEINKVIQQHRHLLWSRSEAIHIVTSESAAGSLRAGLDRPKTVIGFPDFFSIGPLWRLDEKIGQESRQQWLFENINDELDDDDYEIKFSNTLREIEDITEDVPIYIWTGNNPNEQVGVRLYLYLLRNKANNVFLINSTKLYENVSKDKDEQHISLTSQFNANQIKEIFKTSKGNKPLSEDERNQYYIEWEKLSQTNEVLRLWKDDEIKGVPEHYYDPLIIKTIEALHNRQGTKEFIKTGMLIGEILTNIDSAIDFFYLEYRIRHLVYSGILELKGIPKSAIHYSVKLR